MSARKTNLKENSMNQNLKNPSVAGQAAAVEPGRSDSDFDVAKYTPAPIRPSRVPHERRTPGCGCADHHQLELIAKWQHTRESLLDCMARCAP
jgi:hypothetical protein